MKNKHFLNELRDMVRHLQPFGISSVTKKVNPRKYELMVEEFETYSSSHWSPDGLSFRVVISGVFIKIENDPDWLKMNTNE